MAYIALSDCEIKAVAPVTGGIINIVSGLSTYESINGKSICLDGMKISVSGTSIPGYTQTSPVTGTFEAKIIKGTKFAGKIPLALNDIAEIENVPYSNSDDSTVRTIQIQITNVKQNNAQAT